MSRSRLKLLSAMHMVNSFYEDSDVKKYLRDIPLLNGRKAAGPSNRVQRSAVHYSEFLPGFRRAGVQSARTYYRDYRMKKLTNATYTLSKVIAYTICRSQ